MDSAAPARPAHRRRRAAATSAVRRLAARVEHAPRQALAELPPGLLFCGMRNDLPSRAALPRRVAGRPAGRAARPGSAGRRAGRPGRRGSGPPRCSASPGRRPTGTPAGTTRSAAPRAPARHARAAPRAAPCCSPPRAPPATPSWSGCRGTAVLANAHVHRRGAGHRARRGRAHQPAAALQLRPVGAQQPPGRGRDRGADRRGLLAAVVLDARRRHACTSLAAVPYQYEMLRRLRFDPRRASRRCAR